MKELKGTRKKKCLRMSATALAFCLLLTYTNPLETLSVFAAGTPAQDNTLSVSASAQPSEESEEQTVTVGTTEQIVTAETVEQTEETAEPTVSLGIAAEQTVPVGTAAAELAPADLPQPDSVDLAVQELLDRIAALPDNEEYLAKEPAADAGEAYDQWMEGLHRYAGEAINMQETYDELTEEQLAQIPAEEQEKLAAWVQTAMQIAGDSMETLETNGTLGGVSWKIEGTKLTISKSGNGAMMECGLRDYPWYNSRGQITSVVVENGVTSIGSRAFQGYTSLTSVTLPDSISTMGSSVFYYCTSLEKITIPKNLTLLDTYTFCGCTNLKEVTFPAGSVLTRIKDNAFDNIAITSLTIPENVTRLDYYAIQNCSTLESVTLPKGNYRLGCISS